MKNSLKTRAGGEESDKVVTSFNENYRSVREWNSGNKCGLRITRSTSSAKDISLGAFPLNMLIFATLLAIHAGFAGEETDALITTRDNFWSSSNYEASSAL